MTTGSHLRIGLWTAAVLLIGGLPWLTRGSMGPIPFGGCGNPGAFVGAAVCALLFLPAIAAPLCAVPAAIAYVLAASRVAIADPQGALPREALTGYAKLCGALIFVEAGWSVLYLFHRSIRGISGLIYLGFGLMGVLALVGLPGRIIRRRDSTGANRQSGSTCRRRVCSLRLRCCARPTTRLSRLWR